MKLQKVLVIKGKQGTGKGIIARKIVELVGEDTLIIEDFTPTAENFTQLKNLITDPMGPNVIVRTDSPFPTDLLENNRRLVVLDLDEYLDTVSHRP